MAAIKNVIYWIQDNWAAIVCLIGIVIGLYQKVKSLLSNSKENKIEVVKKLIKEFILKMITDAEVNYKDWVKSGEIKRSEVIKALYDEYPILSSAVNQDAMIAYIDEMINDALKTLRNVIKINEENTVTSVESETKEIIQNETKKIAITSVTDDGMIDDGINDGVSDTQGE